VSIEAREGPAVADLLVRDRPGGPGRRSSRRWLMLAGPLLAILGTVYAFQQQPRADPLDPASFPSLRREPPPSCLAHGWPSLPEMDSSYR
jgi:hypothetical protein